MLQNSAKNRSEQLIYQRRATDQAISTLSTKLRQEFYEKNFASWENKGKVIQSSKFTEQRLKQMREESNSQLEERRYQLAEMLGQEHEQFKAEILSMVETPDQVKERMKVQLYELKTKKESDRLEFAEKQKVRQFRENTDEIRKLDSEFNALQAVAYRNMQMVEKQQKLENNYNEDMIYAQLYSRDIKKKERAEQEKESFQQERMDERNRVVAIQQQINEGKRRQETDIVGQEKVMLKSEWQKEEQRNRQTLNELAEYKKGVQEEIALNNEQQKQMKMVVKQQEKENDKAMIRQVLEKESAIARMEIEVKERQKEETKQFLMNFKNRANESNAGDQVRDRMIEEENGRQWDRKEAVWAKEEENRIKLLHEVYNQRGDNVEQKSKYISIILWVEKIKEDIITDKIQDMVILKQTMEGYEQEDENKRRLNADKIQMTKTNLLRQMDEKQMRQFMLREQKEKEEENIRREKIEYERKIESEKAKGKALVILQLYFCIKLDELRKKRPY